MAELTITEDEETLAEQSPTPRSRRRDLLLVVVGFLAVVLVAEVTARALSGRLLDPIWTARIAAHLEKIDEINENADPSTEDRRVVILGSSSAGAGIDPRQLTAESPDVEVTYNFWLPGTSIRALSALHPVVVEERYDPDVVVLALTSREMNDLSEEQAEKYESLLDSNGMRRATNDQRWLAEVEEAVSGWSDLVAYRSTFTDPPRLQEELRRSGDLAAIDEFGMLTDQRARTEPRITERHVQQEREALNPFSVGGRETDALRTFVDNLRDDGVEVLIVNLPVLAEFVELHPNGVRDLEDYTAALRTVAADTDTPFLDAAGEFAWDRDLFGNENHLNGRGAARLTELIADALQQHSSE